VNYALEILAARQKRDAAIERARAEARRLVAQAAIDRDLEIRQLRAAEPGMTLDAIAEEVGCCRSQVYEVLYPARREAYNRRRRLHAAGTRRERSDVSQPAELPAAIDIARRRQRERSGSSTNALPVGA